MRRDDIITALEELDHISDVLDCSGYGSMSNAQRMADHVGDIQSFLRRELHEIETRLLARAQQCVQATSDRAAESLVPASDAVTRA